MRILQSVSFFSPQRGGGVIATVYDLSRALARRGHEVTIFTSDFELDQAYVDSLEGVRVRTFPYRMTLGGRPLFLSGVCNELAESDGFDVIHMHECRSFLNLVLSRYAHQHDIAYIVDGHGAAARTSLTKIKRIADLVYGRRLLKGADWLIAETDIARGEYRKYGVADDNIAVIYPPFPFDESTPLPSPGRFRDAFGITEKHIIAYMGRIARIKGLDFLVRSFEELTHHRDDVILTIIGADDGYQEILQRTIGQSGIGDRVRFTGFLSGDDKMAALVDSTVLVQPSIYEQGFPKPCIEAILCGTPTILSSGTGAAAIADRIGAAYSVQYDQVGDLVRAIDFIIDNPEVVAAKVARDREAVLSNLSMEAGVTEYERLYESCLRKRRERTASALSI